MIHVKKRSVIISSIILLSVIAGAVSLRVSSAEAAPYYEDVAQFPASYQDELYELKEAHPNWRFEIFDTGLEWSDVVYNQTNPANRSLIPSYFDSSLAGEYYGDGWSCATQLAVEYYLDPRNWLTEDYIFQFEKLTYNGDTQGIATVQKVLANTFMSGYIEGYEDEGLTYVQAFRDIGEYLGVSPVHLAARVKQEQGIYGSSELISGTYPGYEGYYNYYNIQATGVTHEQIVKNGLTEAMAEGWNNRYSALLGGSQKLAQRYILRGQDTLYLQKFDVDGSYDGLYWHQYMQNVCAPSNEGYSTKTAYEKAGMLDEAFVFKIPVYANMPQEEDGLVEIDGKFYLFQDGMKVTGEYQLEGVWYYFDPETGEMIRNKAVTIDGRTYCYDMEGHKAYGIVYLEGYWYRCDESTGEAGERKYAGDIFIAEDYARYNPDVAAVYSDEETLLKHWLEYGIYEGRRPSRLYDGNYYIFMYGDKATAAGDSPEKVLGSFVMDGMQYGYSGSEEFNLVAYMACNEDLYYIFGTDFESYYYHYIENCLKEERIHSAAEAVYADCWLSRVVFDPEAYAEKNGDLYEAYGMNEDELFRHWLKCGIYEGRVASRIFETQYYLQNNGDVNKAFEGEYVPAVMHFYRYGMSEIRNSSSVFDVYGYMIKNADLLEAFAGDAKQYYLHYSNFGYSENREMVRLENMNLSLIYDAEYYCRNNPDVVSAYGDGPGAYLHFTVFGMNEGRQGAEGFNVLAYKSRYNDLSEAYGDNLKFYYIHYINFGYAEGRDALP